MKKIGLVLLVSMKDGAHAMTQKIRKDFLVFLRVMGTVIQKTKELYIFLFISSKENFQ